MRRLLGLITLLAPAVTHAQPGAVDPQLPPPEVLPPAAAVSPPSAAPMGPVTDPQVLALARGTYAAAARGDCVGARVLGSQIARLDPAFHRAVIKTDPVITQCRPAARSYSLAAPQEAPAPYLPERTGTPPVDGNALAGEFLLGGLFTIGGAVSGAFIGSALENNGGCSDECWGGILLGGFLGGTVMAAVGVNLAGDSDTVDGSLGLAIGGSMLGGLLGIGAISNGNMGEGGLIVLIVAPTVGAMLGFNLHRVYKPQRARQPTYDRRLAVQPSSRIDDGSAFTLAAGSF